MPYQIITAPILEPVTLTEAKAQCRVDITDDDTLITALITSARQYCEQRDWRAYLTQTIEFWLDQWPASDQIELPRPPLQSVTKIEYYDSADVKLTLSSSAYFADLISEPGRVVLRYGYSWPSSTLRTANAICVTYRAGWTLAASVPSTIKQAMLLLIGHWYENREASTVGAVSREIDFSVQALLGVDRAFRF